MKTSVRLIAVVAAAAFAKGAQATPSTVFWTPATTYVQPFLIPHLTFDTYFGDRAAYPIISGLTMGVLPFEKFQAEVGIDAWFPYKNSPLLGYPAFTTGPFQLNAKIGVPDGAFGEWFPGISAGIYGVGFTKGTQFDVLHAEIGKTLFFGTLTAGGYYGAGGDDGLWTGSNGVQRGGFIGSYVTPDIVLDLKGLNKINFFADVQTGKNTYGGWGTGIGIYFTPAIDILTGPIFFIDKSVQPGQQSFMWTIQLDIDIDFGQAPKAAPAPAPAPQPPAETPKA